MAAKNRILPIWIESAFCQFLTISNHEIDDCSGYRKKQYNKYPHNFIVSGKFMTQDVNDCDDREQQQDSKKEKNQQDLK
jgi:hypothetical protein